MQPENQALENPWVKNMLDELIKTTQANVVQWGGVVMKMGLDEAEQEQWSKIFIGEVEGTYSHMIEEVNDRQTSLIEEIEQLLKKSEILCKQLHINMPRYGADQLSLYSERKILYQRIQEYESIIQKQKKEIAHLVKQENKFCVALGITPKSIPESPLPTPEIIFEFKQYLETLDSQIFERQENYLKTKSLLLEIVNELDFKPSLDFEKMVISPDDSLFLVTDSNMLKLNEFHQLLQDQLVETKDEIASLRDKIKCLWELLAENVTDTDAFLQKHTGNTIATLEGLRAELKRCENMKKANIEVFVKRLRQELVILWEKCHFIETEKDFSYFHTDLYNEDLLTLHDMEIQKLQQYYNENKKLFMLLEERHDLWQKMVVLEEKAAGPDRYKNRGGNLLQEEKERNALSKRIPHIEKQLQQLAYEYEIRTRKVFTSRGESIAAIINNAHSTYDQEKKLKLSVRKQQRDKTLTPGKSMLGLTPCKSSQNLAASVSSAKRKLLCTPIFPAKRNCGVSNKENVAKTAPPKLTVNGARIGPSRYSLERAKRIKKCRRISQRMEHKLKAAETTCSTVSEHYQYFENAMRNKDGCRSTLFLDSTMLNQPLAAPLPVTPHRVKNTIVTTPSTTGGVLHPRSPRAIMKTFSATDFKMLF